jgi:hypothetical protein
MSWCEIEPCTEPNCEEPECLGCGVRDCPGNEPLHYHHDGCPYCAQLEETETSKVIKISDNPYKLPQRI